MRKQIRPTAAQQHIFQFIAGFVEAFGRSPSYAEMAALLGFTSKGAIHRLVIALEERGHIVRHRHRAPRIDPMDAKAVSRVPCGSDKGQPLYFVTIDRLKHAARAPARERS